MRFTATELKEWSISSVKNGKWTPARPDNWRFEGMWLRLKWAWLVLCGKYDVVDWEND